MLSYSKTELARISSCLCRKCGKPRNDNGTRIHCRPCADTWAASASARKKIVQEKREADRFCIACGAAAPTNGKRCAKCSARSTEASRRLYALRSENGYCRACRTPHMKGSELCLKHWLQGRSRFHFGHVRNWEMLLDIAERQEWRCYYTGESLSAGDNMSLDHRTPKTSPHYPGDDDFRNLVWTTRATNLAKNDRTEAEFLDLCRRVLNTASMRMEGLRQHPNEVRTGRRLAPPENPPASAGGRR